MLSYSSPGKRRPAKGGIQTGGEVFRNLTDLEAADHTGRYQKRIDPTGLERTYICDTGNDTGVAPNAFNQRDWLADGVRILRPLMSSSVLMGLLRVIKTGASPTQTASTFTRLYSGDMCSR